MKTEEKGKKGKALSRREFLKTSAIGVAGVAAGSLLGARTGIAQKAAQKSIKIGCFGAYSGPAAEAGIGSVNGLTLWAEKVNREGGLLGRQIELINRDSEGKPEQGVRYARDYAAQGFDFIYQYGPSSESFAALQFRLNSRRRFYRIATLPIIPPTRRSGAHTALGRPRPACTTPSALASMPRNFRKISVLTNGIR